MAEVGKINKVSASDVGLLDSADAANIAKVNTLTFSQLVPLLDVYPGAAVAYSVRKLSSTYTGSAMRVRRTVAPFDEQDIGFASGGNLDEAAIVTFGGSDTLTVSVWYDQSGNGVNASQTTASSQPHIYDGSAVITENSKPAIESFSSSSDHLTFPTTTSTDFCFINVRTWQSGDVGYGGASGTFGGFGISTSLTRYRFSGATSTFSFSASNGLQFLDFGNRASNLLEVHFNGVSGGVNANSGVAALNILMAGNGGGFFLDGKTQEFIIYSSDQSTNRTGIETDINTYFNIWT